MNIKIKIQDLLIYLTIFIILHNILVMFYLYSLHKIIFIPVNLSWIVLSLLSFYSIDSLSELRKENRWPKSGIFLVFSLFLIFSFLILNEAYHITNLFCVIYSG